MRRSRFLFALGLVLSALALVAAGCGGDDEEDTAATTAAETTGGAQGGAAGNAIKVAIMTDCKGAFAFGYELDIGGAQAALY